MEKIFDWCVTFLESCALRLSMFYKELSVRLFVIVIPEIILILTFLNRYLWRELRQARTAAREYVESKIPNARSSG
jgi:hypothetical protein